MTNPLARIESHPHEAKRLIGINYDQFLALVSLAEKRHREKQAEIEKNKVRIIAKGGGRKPEMSPKEGICLCLVYLRQKPIFEILGLLFDISKTKANDAFNYWVDILREILPASQIEEASVDSQKYQELQQMLSEYELIVDSAEQATARPVDYQEQKRYYSGKKKMHTLKNQFIVLPGGEDIVDICVGMLGKTSDINLFRDTRNKFADSQRFIGDKAYIGDDAITTPHKKRKNTEISEFQKQENKQLSSRRIAVEHMICRVKIFRVASEKFRLARHRYSQVILAVCGLIRLRLNRLVSLTINT
ncbi:IS5/IS1182 family transposase (plasmid) [Nostoc sp. C052]|uniref:transposase family protein n=2 Tax=Nostoc sp. C052 TaxID=2576902 RepID=UPI0015C30D91|nr:transposase family protein [Nostoc sp. C052]QLE40190.1 IS5/IS1182 family transposase [Nostoc sp. C052]QLE42938.1 IS5/IS1182 family transposase [Nostoc sp. C052]QLE45841.1 IS5/IS1182 family transposase [Nostoc sp. C052]